MYPRRSIALFCLAVLLLAVLIPGASGLPFATLAPLWLFVAAVAILSIHCTALDSGAPSTPFLAVVSNRAPPIA